MKTSKTVGSRLMSNDYMMEEFGISLLGRNSLASYLLNQLEPQTATETAHLLKVTNDGVSYLLGVEVLDDASPLFAYLRDALLVLDYLCDKLQNEIASTQSAGNVLQTSLLDFDLPLNA